MRWPWQPKPERPLPDVPILPPDNLQKQPNWDRILVSDIWTQEIYPYYYSLRQLALEKLMEAKTTDELRFLQGQAKALDAMLKTPAQMVALERDRVAREAKFAPQENEDDGPGRRSPVSRVAKLAARRG